MKTLPKAFCFGGRFYRVVLNVWVVYSRHGDLPQYTPYIFENDNVGMFLCDMQYLTMLGCFFVICNIVICNVGMFLFIWLKIDLFLVITKFRLVVMVIYPNIPHIYSKMTMLGCFFVICNIGMFLCDMQYCYIKT